MSSYALNEIQELVDFARTNGLKKLMVDLNTAEFEFWDRPTPAPAEATQDAVPLKGDEMPSDEEMLMWSTDTYDQMQIDQEKPEEP